MEFVLAASPSLKSTLGLVAIFFVLFPVLAHGLIGFAVAQALGERQDNERFRRGDDQPSQG